MTSQAPHVDPEEPSPGSRGAGDAGDGGPQPPPRIGRTERIVRPGSGRVVAGVCAGVAEHLGVGATSVRWVFVALTVLGGTGVVAYALLWIFTPVDADRPVGVRSDGASETGTASDDARGAAGGRRHEASSLVMIGTLVLCLGALLFAVTLSGGASPPPLVIAGAAAVLMGLYLAWTYLDDLDLGRAGPGLGGFGRDGLVPEGDGGDAGSGPRDERGDSGRARRRVWWRGLTVPLIGLALVVTGVLTLIVSTQGLAFTWEVALATAAVLAGVVIVAMPWGVRAWRRFVAQEQERIRETERADMAAHLHDSVLQTLALIQRTDDVARVKLLARVQERELRQWLYGGASAPTASFAAALTAIVHEVEEAHGVPVDVVTTGDCAPCEATGALLRALREALLNAVRHGEPPVSVYAEAGASRVEAFVRDHGPGFDVDAVPEGRLGVRESIIGRMQRAGGHARIRHREDGTEVELAIDVATHGNDPNPEAGPREHPFEHRASRRPQAANMPQPDPAPDKSPDVKETHHD